MLQFVNMQLAIRFGNGPLAMHPFGLDAIQPGTFARKGAHHDATAAFPLDATVGRLEPCPHGMADVPRGLGPHHQQRCFPFRRQALRQPLQKLRRHRTDRTTVHQTEEHALCVGASQPITRQSLGLWVVTVWLILDQAQRLGSCPGMQGGLGETAPPDLILQPQDPCRMAQRQCDQAIAPLFFRAYWGSGLVIQCFARFQLVSSCLTAWRMVSSLLRRSVTPCA